MGQSREDGTAIKMGAVARARRSRGARADSPQQLAAVLEVNSSRKLVSPARRLAMAVELVLTRLRLAGSLRVELEQLPRRLAVAMKLAWTHFLGWPCAAMELAPTRRARSACCQTTSPMTAAH